MLQDRMRTVPDPKWYIQLASMVMEQTGGDPVRTIALADAAYMRQPHPPLSDKDKASNAIANRLALDDVDLAEPEFAKDP